VFRVKQIFIILILLFCLSTPCLAEWDKSDTTLLVMRLIDWGQTRDIATRKWEPPYVSDYDGSEYVYHETNHFLGKHPSIKEANTYFASAIVIDFIISHLKTKNNVLNKFKEYYQQYMICNTFKCITGNYNWGIRIKF